MVQKKGDASRRPRGDYRVLDAFSIVIRYYAHSTSRPNLTARLCLPKLPWHELTAKTVPTEGVQTTAITTPFGLSELPCVNLWLRIADHTFHRLTDTTT